MLDDSIAALKRQLADEILRVHNQTHMLVAAMGLGIGAPRLSDLRRGRLKRFSLERLIRILAIVDRRVDLTIVTVGPEQVRWLPLIVANAQRRSAAKTAARRVTMGHVSESLLPDLGSSGITGDRCMLSPPRRRRWRSRRLPRY